MNPQDVVDTAVSQTLSEGELCLRILAELNALVHCADNIFLAEELVRDKLPRPNSDSERDAAVVTAEYLAMLRTSPILPLGWRCIQIVHVVDDFCFKRVLLCSDSGAC